MLDQLISNRKVSAPIGYGMVAIKFEIHLDEGSPLLITHDRTGKKMLAPAAGRNGCFPFPISDTTEYVIGGERGEYAKAWMKMMEDVQSLDSRLPQVIELVEQLRNGDYPDGFDELQQAEPGQRLTFFVDGEHLAELPSIQLWWAGKVGDSKLGDAAKCLVCGQLKPTCRVLPSKLKGVPKGQATGAHLISFDKPSFESWGLENSANCPICIDCAEASYGELNAMIADKQRSWRNDQTLYLFWQSGLADVLDSDFSETDVVEFLDSINTGHAHSISEDCTIMAITGNGGRVAVKSLDRLPMSGIITNLKKWFASHRLLIGEKYKYYPLWLLAKATEDGGKVRSSVYQSLARCALFGVNPPLSLLNSTLRHCDRGEISMNQKALIQLITAYYIEEEKVEDSVGYKLGQFLGYLEWIERKATKRENTQAASMFGQAMRFPAAVFPRLIEKALKVHLPKIEGSGGIGGKLKSFEIELPGQLSLLERGCFVAGYTGRKFRDE